MNEQCHISTIRGCPYLDEYEIDGIQGCKLSCIHPDTGDALMPENCPLDVCAEIKAAEDKRGEKVLELIINHINGMAIGPALKDATIQGIRQTYHEKYGE